jgi:hypothetical protein
LTDGVGGLTIASKAISIKSNQSKAQALAKSGL